MISMKKNTLIALAFASVIICIVSMSLLLMPKDQDDEKANDENFELKPPIVTEIPKDDVESTTEAATTAINATSEAVVSSTTQEKPKPTVTNPIVDSIESAQVTKPKPVSEEKDTTAGLVEEKSVIMTDEVIVREDKSDIIPLDPSEYIESEAYGDNPFDDGNKTQIVDTPVDEYVPDGGDRPGEGIHF